MNLEEILNFLKDASTQHLQRYRKVNTINAEYGLTWLIADAGYHFDLSASAFLSNIEFDSPLPFTVYVFPAPWKETLQKEKDLNSEKSANLASFSTTDIRLFADFELNILYFLDTSNRVGYIALDSNQVIDGRPYVTPFRLMINWIADCVDAEVLHASCIGNHSNKVALISGFKGSGKSTLALQALKFNEKIISDDAVLVKDSRVSAIYARAKLEPQNEFTTDLLQYSFSLDSSHVSKRPISLLPFAKNFVRQGEMRVIIWPEIGKSTRSRLDRSGKFKEQFIENSLRETYGGVKKSRSRIAAIFDEHPTYRLEIGSDNRENIVEIMNLISRH
jgi:hypothetical protein